MAQCLAIILRVCRGRAAAVMPWTAGTRRGSRRRRSCREVRVKIGNLVSSVQHPRPGPGTTSPAPAPISHTLAGTQVGGRREDGGTLIWFLPRFEFKLERGGGLGWRSPHSLARYLHGIFCIFQKYITAYCIQSKCQKYLTFYSNVCVFFVQLIFVSRIWT